MSEQKTSQKITLAKGLNMGLRKAMEGDPKVLLMGCLLYTSPSPRDS